LSANDVFYRALRLDKAFDCEAISDFSVLRHGRLRIRDLEVATLLLGTAGCMSDSHSDDPDGCNHCVAGSKLWLAWDRLEGERAGLEDCEYAAVYTRAKFDLRRFLGLSSAHWFVVSAGMTLFLPGNLTHKVIAVERYLGISSFYVGLPNALTSLTRWRLRGASMITAELQDEIARLLLERLEWTAAAGRAARQQWGYRHIGEALEHWADRHNPQERSEMMAQPSFRKLQEQMQLHRR
jgi:hypothetical protein